MVRTLTLDPVTRVEGHLAIETQIESGRVVDARVAGRMFRGFEDFLIGRHPVDAARITQRICGICHEVHGIAASIALEDLYGTAPTSNGQILRELILGLHLVTDHIFHFYQLTLPDYLDFSVLHTYRGQDQRVQQIDKLFKNSSGTFSNPGISDPLKSTKLTIEMALGYVDAIAIRKEAASGLASLGGKVPFAHAVLPGGLTTAVTSDRLMKFADALDSTSDFIRRVYLPQARSLAEHFSHYFNVGAAHGAFYSNGGFDHLQGPLFSGGIVSSDGKKVAFDQAKVEERSDSAFFSETGHLKADKKDAYSWVKALQYGGTPMEVGPLARLVVSADKGFANLLKAYGQKRPVSSVMARILARAYEADMICRYLLELLPRYRLEEPTINPIDMARKVSGTGSGLSLAARGALNHHLAVEGGKVTAYTFQVPSTWNFGSKANGKHGTVEQALIGTPISISKYKQGGGEAIEVGRIVRSFDPCLACAIH